MARISQIIDGKFRILRLLDRGGMSKVYLAEDTRLRKQWVVKEILKNEKGQESLLFIQSALNEADMIKSLDHPGIVRIVDIIEEPEALYIIEDYVTGTSLSEVARRNGIRLQELLSWTEEICGVLAYLHGQDPPVIYRDLKPENLILTDSGHLKLIDFGIARRYKPGQRTDTIYLGTERFAAPEQYEEFGGQTDKRTDIYGLGTTLKYLLAFCDEKSPALSALAEKCAAYQPGDRYQRIEDVRKDLQWITPPGSLQVKKPQVSLLRILLIIGALVGACLGLYAWDLGREHGILEIGQFLDMTAEMAEDGIFSVEEEEHLMKALLPDLAKWKNQDGFEELAYRIGKLYWQYYAYGNPAGKQGTQGQMLSAQWFHLARDAYPLAAAYDLLGQFYRFARESWGRNRNDPTTDSQTGNSFGAFLVKMLKMLEQMPGSEGDVQEKEELYACFAGILLTYMEQFRGEGVSLGQMNRCFWLLSQEIGHSGVEPELSSSEDETGDSDHAFREQQGEVVENEIITKLRERIRSVYGDRR